MMLSAEKENVYVSWDYSTPGISFSLVPGRITIFKNTLEALGYPEYYRFLFDTENRRFAVQVCEIDDEGAHRLPETFLHDHYAIKSMDLVRFVYSTCDWNRKVTYRIPGEVYPAERLVNFNLVGALELHEGRLKEPER